MKTNKSIKASFLTAAMCMGLSGAASAEATLPDPDGKPADMTKPVQVFILMGQSNMVGMGKIAPAEKEGSLEHAVKTENLYPFLVDDAGAWTQRKDVRYVRYMSGKKLIDDWMTMTGKTIGPEFGIGYQVGDAIEAPVMILKSCIGNRSLGWDLLPPGSKGYDFDSIDKKTKEKVTYTYAGYGESPMKWVKGTTPVPIGWKAGTQWDSDIADAKTALSKLAESYPDSKGYEVAGFFYWQGDKDRYDEGLAAHYEENLVNLIKALRKEFNAPNAKFVCATLGQTAKEDAPGNDKLILDAQLAVDGETGKHPEFKGSVSTVYSHPLSKGGASNGHYNGDARTYMNVGLGMGEAMTKLLK